MTYIKSISILFLIIFLIPFKVAAIDLWDTLYICPGEAIQLKTIPYQSSYSWSPNENINNDTVFNPIVNPETTTTYLVDVEPLSNVNLIYNGDFSQGNIGFISGHFYTSGPTTQQGFYSVFPNTQDFNIWFENCEDNSPTDDNMMFIADCATSPGITAWYEQVVVIPNQSYTFSAWFTNIFWTAPPLIQVTINGVQVGTNLQLETQNCLWQEFTITWNSQNNTTAAIDIQSLNLDIDGNDFAMDDVVFQAEVEAFTDTFTVVVLNDFELQIDTVFCASENIFYDGYEIPADTQFVIHYNTFDGCDSIIYINTTGIDTSYFETRIDDLCPGDTVYYMGFPITKDTAICDVYTNLLGCDSSICYVVNFFSEATINHSNVSPTCLGDSDGLIHAMPFAGTPPYDYNWSTGDQTESIENLLAGIYTLSLVDASGCIAIKNIELFEPDSMILNYSIFEPSCFDNSDGYISLDISGGTPDYLISFDNNIFSSNTSFDNINGGEYEVMIEDGNNCMAEFSILVPEPEPIIIDLIPDAIVELGESFLLDATIQADTTYQIQWIPAIDLDCTDCEDPTSFTNQNITYQIIVEDLNGCRSTEEIQLRLINNYEVFIPNIFSPNNDNINDYFEIYGSKGVREIISFRIFNRWGAEVFRKDHFFLGDQFGKWDGQFKSKNVAPGVFVYMAQILFIDGEIKVFGGDVTVIR